MPETVPEPEAHKSAPPRFIVSLLLLIYGFAVAFWLWAKWLYAPQIFVLPPLPPVEVLISLVEKTLGAWLVAILTASSLAMIAIDAVKARRAARMTWWTKSLVRESVVAILIHVAVSIAGTILFFAVLALMPGAGIRGKGLSDPVVQGLILFSAFLSLIMSGPITGLLIAARALARRRYDGFPVSKTETLNHAVAVLTVPLVVLWIASGYARPTYDSLRQNSSSTRDDRGSNLVVAAREADLTNVRSLLRHGVPANAKDSSGTTALKAAASNGQIEIVRELLQASADVNATDNFGRTALMSAAANCYPDGVRALLDSGAAVNAKDREGKTALMLAASGGNEAIVMMLLNAKADLNARSASGDTALIAAARAGHTGIVRLLLGSGADPAGTDNAGKSALDWARSLSHLETAAALRSARPNH